MTIKRIAIWTLVVIVVLAVVGFLSFLYFIPPFTTASPETFIDPERNAAVKLDRITDPKTRAIAERGKYIVMTVGCVGCHVAPGPQGPIWEQYLAGGAKATFKGHGTWISARTPTSAGPRRRTRAAPRTWPGGGSLAGWTGNPAPRPRHPRVRLQLLGEREVHEVAELPVGQRQSPPVRRGSTAKPPRPPRLPRNVSRRRTQNSHARDFASSPIIPRTRARMGSGTVACG